MEAGGNGLDNKQRLVIYYGLDRDCQMASGEVDPSSVDGNVTVVSVTPKGEFHRPRGRFLTNFDSFSIQF